jgi:hypothetical protein
VNAHDDRDLENREVETDLNRPATPEITTGTTPGKLGVYDKPERRGLPTEGLIGLLILALIIAFFLWQLVF